MSSELRSLLHRADKCLFLINGAETIRVNSVHKAHGAVGFVNQMNHSNQTIFFTNNILRVITKNGKKFNYIIANFLIHRPYKISEYSRN
jgi:hypothetical protein